MAWTFTRTTAPGAVAADVAEAEFGWRPLMEFHRILAAEEGIDLPRMAFFRGATSWQTVQTPMRLLFDLRYIGGEHPTTAYPVVAARLREIHQRWSEARFATDPGPDWMPAHLVERVRKLVEVLDDCSRTGTRLVVR